MTHTSRIGRIAAGASALVLLGAGLVGTAASAEPGNAPGNIDFEATGSITLHKYDGNEGDKPSDGTTASDPGGSPLDGIIFHLQRVTNIDLTDQTDWDELATLVPDDIDSGDLGSAVPFPATDLTGETSLSGHGLGVYLVTEVGHGSHNVVSPALPFLVTVPFPHASGWLYDVHVYPKNKTDGNAPVKDVTNPAPGAAQGSTVTWTITKELPALQAGEAFKKVEITDDLDSRLSTTAGDITVTVAGTDATADFDITVTNDREVTVTAKNPGALEAGQVIVVTIGSTVTGNLDEDSAEIRNSAFVNVNDSTQETNDKSVYYGAIQVAKTDAGDGAPLAGAEFNIFVADADGQPTGGALNGSDPLVTNADGEFDDPFYVWVGRDVGASQTYVLVETKAPTGYTLPEDGSAQVAVTVEVGENATVHIAVGELTNSKSKVPDLPLTGAQGTLLFTLIGVGLIGAGATAIAVRRSRSNN